MNGLIVHLLFISIVWLGLAHIIAIKHKIIGIVCPVVLLSLVVLAVNLLLSLSPSLTLKFMAAVPIDLLMFG